MRGFPAVRVSLAASLVAPVFPAARGLPAVSPVAALPLPASSASFGAIASVCTQVYSIFALNWSA